MILDRPLREARVAVVAPAGPSRNPAALAEGLAMLTARVGSVRMVGDVTGAWRHFSGTDADRGRALADALTDPDVDLVWAMRGGYGVGRLLDALPWASLKPRPVVGFSDLTALLDALSRRAGSPVVHGPMVHSLAATAAPWQARVFDLLDGRPLAPLVGEAWVRGDARGPIRGGNLALLAAHCGTPWQIDARGALLALEDVGEPAYRIDRMLLQLRQAGVFTGVRGVLVGTFSDCTSADASYQVLDVVREAVAGLGVPVLGALPFGHTAANAALPIGREARIDGDHLRWD